MPLTVNVPPYGEMELSPEFVEALLEAVRETERDGKERGVTMCMSADGQWIKPGAMCEGSVCSIRQERETCGMARMEIGFFHTHPGRATSNWSAGDGMAILYKSPKDLVHVGCRTGISPFSGGRELRCEIPSWLPTRETEKELDDAYREVQNLYDEWERTETRPTDGRWSRYDAVVKKLEPVMRNVAITPVDNLEREYKYNRGRECAGQMRRGHELRQIAESAAQSKLRYGDGMQCDRIREIKDLATEMRQRAETAPTAIPACRQAITELGDLEMYAETLMERATCAVLREIQEGK